jgi:hypothetical protein
MVIFLAHHRPNYKFDVLYSVVIGINLLIGHVARDDSEAYVVGSFAFKLSYSDLCSSFFLHGGYWRVWQPIICSTR